VQLDRSIERIAENNNLTLAAFRKALEGDGVQFDKFREEVRRQIIMQRLREREVDERIEVSESEIDLYLEEQKAGGAERVEYNVAHILVRLPEQASPERIAQARSRAEKARDEARTGADFGRLAASYSDAGDALQGGQMGWRPSDRLPELFATALQAMKPGEVSDVLRSPGGFHVLRLVERRGAGEGRAVTQNHARHILIRTNELVSETEARRRLSELRERIVAGGADFAQIARLNSADVSAAQGGDLGWVYPGDTVPEFERVMTSLKPRRDQPAREDTVRMAPHTTRRATHLAGCLRSASGSSRARRCASASRTRRTRTGCASFATRRTLRSGSKKSSGRPAAHVPRKRFGQHFLHDPGVLRRIVDSIAPAPDDAIVEIGPGEGALTRVLLARLPRLTAIEIDRDLAARLAEEFTPSG
jgi:parvulin-like peptidyl-prolyl isomerase